MQMVHMWNTEIEVHRVSYAWWECMLTENGRQQFAVSLFASHHNALAMHMHDSHLSLES